MDPESKRARIFSRVLDFINAGDWDEGEGFLIFGSEAYDKHLGIRYEDDESSTVFDEFLRRLVTEIKRVGGEEDVAKRISLSSASRGLGEVDLSSFFDTLSAGDRAHIVNTVSAVAENLARNPKSNAGSFRNISDDIDASLAAEAIEQLNSSYLRVVTLDEMARPATPFDGTEYFEEAHRCQLGGQKIASAVLCRAVLEAALVNATDQTGWIKNQATIHQRSYIEAMLLEARILGLIDGSRFNQGLQVRDAGNDAIHGAAQFHDKYGNRIPEIIDGTRKILEDLFSPKQ